jgi:hypothetical protein
MLELEQKKHLIDAMYRMLARINRRIAEADGIGRDSRLSPKPEFLCENISTIGYDAFTDELVADIEAFVASSPVPAEEKLEILEQLLAFANNYYRSTTLGRVKLADSREETPPEKTEIDPKVR